MFLYIFSSSAEFCYMSYGLSLNFFPGYYIVLIAMVFGALFHYIFKVIIFKVIGKLLNSAFFFFFFASGNLTGFFLLALMVVTITTSYSRRVKE